MKFGIFGNSAKSSVTATLRKLSKYFNKNKIEYFISKDIFLSGNEISGSRYFSNKYIAKNSDVIISLGGDGTFLNTARIVGNSGIPILGVNLGGLGFLSEILPDETIKFLDEIKAGDFEACERTVLKITLPDNKVLHGLNDIVLDREKSIRLIDVEIFYNDEYVGRFLADGAIVSTPTGSTAYSLSAGGPVVTLMSKVMLLTPICPHSLNIRPIIFPDDGTIKLRVRQNISARLTADGQKVAVIKSPAEIKISKAGHTIKTIKRKGQTYFATLNTKLFWTAERWRN